MIGFPKTIIPDYCYVPCAYVCVCFLSRPSLFCYCSAACSQVPDWMCHLLIIVVMSSSSSNLLPPCWFKGPPANFRWRLVCA